METEISFSKLAGALNAIAKVTGRSFKIDRKVDRIRFQKVVYLLKFFNYPAAKPFVFNMYVYGPYSRSLASLYYSEENLSLSKFSEAKDVPEDVLAFIKEADDNGTLFLEALVTTMDFRKTSKDYKEAVKNAESIKARIPKEIWDRVLEFLLTKKNMKDIQFT